MKAYEEKIIDSNIFLRTFRAESKQYVWHRDREDRTIEVLSSGKNWSVQVDNELPVLLHSSMKLFIPKMVFHRLIPGTGNLVLKVTKHD